MLLVKACCGSRVVLNADFFTLCAFSPYVWLRAWLWAPRHRFLLRKSELGLSAAGLVHRCHELPGQVWGRYCVSSSGEGLPFRYLLRGEEEETGLNTASDLGFTSKSETEFKTGDCSDPDGSIWFLMHTWAASDIKSRDKSHLHLSSQQYFLNMNCDFLGDLWGRNAITYTTVTWDNIYYQQRLAGQAQARKTKSFLQGIHWLTFAEMPTTKKVKWKMEHECTGLDWVTIKFEGGFAFVCCCLFCSFYFGMYLGNVLHKCKG